MLSLRAWMRFVGVFYLVLFVLMLPFVSVPTRAIAEQLDLDTGTDTFAVVVDTWFMFGLEVGAIGVALLVASRDPLRNVLVAQLVILIEATRGIVDDVYLLARGYAPAFALGWIAIHAAVIATGLVAIRRERASAQRQGTPAAAG